jgi:radical SAM superfamily enzyme YgiQ (UPF0313 family)
MIVTLKDQLYNDRHGDLLIVDPPWDVNDEKRNGTRASSRWPHEFNSPGRIQSSPPFFMAHATSFLRSHGVNAHQTVFSPPRIPYQQFLEQLRQRTYQVVVVEMAIQTLQSDLAFARHLKENLGCMVAAVGAYPSASPDETLSHDCVDAVLRGEYEFSALKLWRTRRPGIYEYDLVEDVNSLPYMDRRDIVFDRIQYQNGGNHARYKNVQYQMWGSRGCPYRCAFCVYPPVMYNNSPYRPRSADHIAGELDHLIRMHGNNQFHVWFDDDTFNIGDDRMCAIAEEFGRRGVEYSAMCRADTTRKFETLKTMAKNGFVHCAIGVESGCQELVDNCNKNLNLEDVRRFRDWCKELNIAIHMTFTFGLEGETQETMERTKHFIREVQPDSLQTSACAPVPGTPYHEMLKKQGLINETTNLDGSQILNMES